MAVEPIWWGGGGGVAGGGGWGGELYMVLHGIVLYIYFPETVQTHVI